MQTFEQLNLRPATLTALRALRFAVPTPVQAQAIPELLASRDLVAQARTGTGKTAAFGIPLVERLGTLTTRGVVGLVLVPTRELALQVSEQLHVLARGTHLRVAAVYGGVGYEDQRRALGAHEPLILVATPGRLLDHLSRRTVRLDGVRILILDEADRMLDMGFLPDVERLIRLTPRERQTALFGATLSGPIQGLAQRFLRNPSHVRIEDGPVATPLAEQFKIDLQRSQKPQGLVALLGKEQPQGAIVFTRTKHLARRLARQLEGAGFRAVALQGNMTQNQRERALGSFREGHARILVATDVASRGLDVAHVSHVINYDVPMEPEAYVHRVGRTARMGRSGRAFTFVQGDQRRELAAIERMAGVTLQGYHLGELPPPPPSEARPAAHSEHRGRFDRRRRERPEGRRVFQGRDGRRFQGADRAIRTERARQDA